MEIVVGWKEWEQWAGDGWNTLPLIIRSQHGPGGLPRSWKKAWEIASPYSVVLESGKGGRYTYLGLRPSSVLTGKGERAEVLWTIGGCDSGAGSSAEVETGVLGGAPLEVLRRWMAPFTAPRPDNSILPPFTGGCVGFLSYDVVRSLERLPAASEDNPGFSDYLWMRLDEIWIYDHEEDQLYCAVHTLIPSEDRIGQEAPGNGAYTGETPSANPPSGAVSVEGLRALYEESLDKAEGMLKQWREICDAAEAVEEAGADNPHVPHIPAAAESGEWPGMSSAFTREKFQQAVLDIQEYIRQGDVFQVNLSLRQEAKLNSSPEEVYEWLRRLNPSPYMGLLRSPGFALSSASPELLVKLHGDKVSARPIAGTRRRGLTPAEDAAMEAELRGSVKETAEHIMLVDLERNDIGRVSAYGSVHVPELMTVERYSHVMHLVSQVNGRIAEGKDAYDTIAAMFPGGTITGAPKVRTMEIIEELEPVRRGPYTGSIGWIDYGGNMELNIIIRTLVVKDGTGYIQTGAGIVIDSDPYREYRECHNKAKAIVKAVLCSEAAWEKRMGGGAEGAKET
ncbi:anthranilate synthase component I family protein [Paenibacillus sp. URB8-2]|uniref:anthranilate synthase component I family protein n=1 Tax=Paenibacillus sp. URB8-2 TaxID=2741301 RepID=UPI0015C234CA|nr:anthranilate synthase component I family protein [Paenibacillus sp. URB8-2]BCG56640.1 aminodeoxychorismate synthase, component I [Paenibacillus sp. URB8-2]